MLARISFCTVGNLASPLRNRALPSIRRRSASSALTVSSPGVVEAIGVPVPKARVTARSASNVNDTPAGRSSKSKSKSSALQPVGRPFPVIPQRGARTNNWTKVQLRFAIMNLGVAPAGGCRSGAVGRTERGTAAECPPVGPVAALQAASLPGLRRRPDVGTSCGANSPAAGEQTERPGRETGDRPRFRDDLVREAVLVVGRVVPGAGEHEGDRVAGGGVRVDQEAAVAAPVGVLVVAAEHAPLVVADVLDAGAGAPEPDAVEDGPVGDAG